MRAALLGLLLWLAAAPVFAQSFPKLSGRVVDQAGVLSPAVEADLTARLAAVEAKNGAQVVVATVSSLQGYEIEEFGYKLGRAWGLGTEARDNGAILLVAPNERRVRIEVGYGLEPLLTDALSSVILQERVLPRFREGDMEGGIVAGANAVMEQVSLDPGEARSRVAAAEARQAASQSDEGGGGGGLFWIVLFFFFFVLPMLGRLGRSRRRRRRRGLGGVVDALVWSAATTNWSGGSRGGGWGGGGGGGFSGGGGSFGGGGSSGSW